jgi:hypothetical protein
MPRTENDKRTPYAKAAERRVARGLKLVAEMKAELYQVEQALGSGRYIYTTNIGAAAVRLQVTMAELEALEEMHDDIQAVAKLAATPNPELSPDQREFLAELAVSGAVSVSRSVQAIKNMYQSLASRGLAREVVPDNSNAHFFEITDAGRELAGRL